MTKQLRLTSFFGHETECHPHKYEWNWTFWIVYLTRRLNFCCSVRSVPDLNHENNTFRRPKRQYVTMCTQADHSLDNVKFPVKCYSYHACTIKHRYGCKYAANINSFRQLFPVTSLTFPLVIVKSLTFYWQLSKSLTFLRFHTSGLPVHNNAAT